ncbi:MAG: hypothetical protein QF441_16170 [Bacteriovoracaceae bacterium]|nr:hypothetical protein [Bacteriovoracaceae bacterium]
MKPNCMKCKHFYITYDQKTPRGCRAYKIQSQQLPSVIVKQANNGQDCIGFTPKENQQSKQKNYNDPKYW